MPVKERGNGRGFPCVRQKNPADYRVLFLRRYLNFLLMMLRDGGVKHGPRQAAQIPPPSSGANTASVERRKYRLRRVAQMPPRQAVQIPPPPSGINTALPSGANTASVERRKYRLRQAVQMPPPPSSAVTALRRAAQLPPSVERRKYRPRQAAINTASVERRKSASVKRR